MIGTDTDTRQGHDMKASALRLFGVGLIGALALSTAACGGDDVQTTKADKVTTTSAPESLATKTGKDTTTTVAKKVEDSQNVKDYFNAIAQNKDAGSFAAPGSTAAVYAAYLFGINLAAPGQPTASITVKDGAVVLDNPSSSEEDYTYSDFIVDPTTGRLADFSVNGTPVQMAGVGATAEACGAVYTVVGARRNDNGLYLVYSVQNNSQMDVSTGSGSYRNVSGLSVEASTTSYNDHPPQALSYGFMKFENSEFGGVAHLEGWSDDNECGDYGSFEFDIQL